MDFQRRFPPLAVKVGLSCLAAQIVISTILAKAVPKGPWSKSAGVTAHQLICLPLMTYLALKGFHVWFSQHNELYEAGVDGRVFGISPVGVEMGNFVWGMMFFWDIPVSFAVPALQDMLMLAHHVGMLFVSGVTTGMFSISGHPIGSYYTPFFFGCIEFSTVFLAIVDLFHPKNKEWHSWLQENTPAAKFAKASMLETGEERYGCSGVTLKLVWGLSLLFMLLQLHWGALVGRQVAKALGLVPNGHDEPTAKKAK